MRNRLVLFLMLTAPLVLALMGPAPLVASAQTATPPDLVITWRATDSSVPSTYLDKALPGVGSPITASAEVVLNGALVNLSSQTIYWYLDGNLIGGGTGEQTISFTAPGFVEIASLRAEVPNYSSGALINTAHIQMVNPEAVIIVPYPNGEYTGSSIAAQAAPYFFSTSQLDELYYQWVVNGQAVTTQENPQDLTIDLANGTSTSAGVPISIGLTVQQTNSPSINAQSSITLNPLSQ